MILVANRLLWTPPSRFIRAMRVAHGFNVADREIAEKVQAGDLVVTADIPLASDVISRGGHALDPRGVLYTKDNIQERLACATSWTSSAGAASRRAGPRPGARATATHSRIQLDRLLSAHGSLTSGEHLLQRGIVDRQLAPTLVALHEKEQAEVHRPLRWLTVGERIVGGTDHQPLVQRAEGPRRSRPTPTRREREACRAANSARPRSLVCAALSPGRAACWKARIRSL